ncbi:hypothetical protein [Peribacillus frigoritolerans]|uniref:hypothetical protein n=1 Tax=Peribacillus castrilensis TaxID=2897690 RepID=UPI00296F8CFF|nr:hypothetical protein [Peribacillus castrilensis]
MKRDALNLWIGTIVSLIISLVMAHFGLSLNTILLIVVSPALFVGMVYLLVKATKGFWILIKSFW